MEYKEYSLSPSPQNVRIQTATEFFLQSGQKNTVSLKITQIFWVRFKHVQAILQTKIIFVSFRSHMCIREHCCHGCAQLPALSAPDYLPRYGNCLPPSCGWGWGMHGPTQIQKWHTSLILSTKEDGVWQLLVAIVARHQADTQFTHLVNHAWK